MPKLTAGLWFDNCALEAAQFYTSVFPNSAITAVARFSESGMGETGRVMSVEFVLDGTEFVGINGGPQFPFTEAVSFQIHCADQAEVDYYWERLVEGGAESECGWLKDRYGLSWQVVPDRLLHLLADPDPRRVEAVTAAMLGMRKIVIAALEDALADL